MSAGEVYRLMTLCLLAMVIVTLFAKPERSA
jgi:hypothetical protein